MRRMLTLVLSATLAIAVSGSALASSSAPGQGVRLIAGGGRIWEGPMDAASSIVGLSGYTTKIGPGDGVGDYVCRWAFRLVDVEGTALDGSTFQGAACHSVIVWAAGPAVDAGMRIGIVGELDGVHGYTVILSIVDATEPGSTDQVRFRLFDGVGDLPVPGELLYDSRDDFTRHVVNRTYLDAGNFQSWVDTLIP